MLVGFKLPTANQTGNPTFINMTMWIITVCVFTCVCERAVMDGRPVSPTEGGLD